MGKQQTRSATQQQQATKPPAKLPRKQQNQRYKMDERKPHIQIKHRTIYMETSIGVVEP